MKLVNVKIIKKNRVYFACEFDSGCPFKIRIDEESKHLEAGNTYDLMLEDQSVRSKWGTDLVYKVVAEHKKEEGVITLKHFRYNSILVEKCRNLGGKWDAENEAWVFSKIVEDEVIDLDEYYNSDIVYVEIKVGECEFYRVCDSLRIAGYSIAKATGRDSGATLSEHTILKNGAVGSGGSLANWKTRMSAGAVFIMKLPKKIAESIDNDNLTVTILEEKEG